jgi:trehalose 6-phosphate phosphatase
MDGHALLARLAAEPALAALLLDLDGVLAPIVARPEDASVPAETRGELKRLAGRYGLVAVITGRDGDDARARTGVEGLVYVGSHGLELEEGAEAWAERLQAFAATVDWPLERKRLTLSFHYRAAQDEEDAVRTLEGVAERARAEGFIARFGRKVLEILPPLEADKGTAAAHLLAERGLRRALYAGDDTTDLDGFRALDGLELGVRVAVASAEGPPALREAADLVVASPAAFLELLRAL